MKNTKPPSKAPTPELPTKVQFHDIDADQAGQRVDNYLIARLKGVPKSRIYRLLRKGEVRVNKGRVKPESKLKAGDIIRIPPIRMSEAKPAVKPGQGLVNVLEASILYETNALMVVNKPAGLAVHGGSGINLGLIEALREMRPEARFLELVHRLDRGTSGCILVAKKRSMLRHLQQAFREKSLGTASEQGITKIYQALVVGAWPKSRQIIDKPLQRYEVAGGERIVKVSPQGKPSQTEFKILKSYREATLIEARPITGRTHQIRVHAQCVGHPLLGDDKYGVDDLNVQMRSQGLKRLFLHASELTFYLPESEEPVSVAAPLGADLEKVLSSLAPE